MTRNEFFKTLGAGALAALPLTPSVVAAIEAQDDDLKLIKNPHSRRLLAIADSDLISSHYLPLRFNRAPIQTIEAGALCYICVCDTPKLYKLERFDAPTEFYVYRCTQCSAPQNSFVIAEVGNLKIYTTGALYLLRAKWWESQNNYAAAWADRSFARLIENA